MLNYNNLFIFIVSYLVTDFLYLYFYDRVLGKKYSIKIMILATLILWILDCTFKLFPEYLCGIDQTGISSIIMIITSFMYAFVCFYGSLKRKMLAVLMYMLLQMAMDLAGLEIAMLITGIKEVYNTVFLQVGVICSWSMITLGTVIGAWAWNYFEGRRWNIDRYQWVCLILPFSQCALMQSAAMRNLGKNSMISWIIVAGVVMGLLANVYMYWLFERNNKRKAVEKEIRILQQQYEIERMKFEQLKIMQEETARMRHEMQNYLMTIKNMEW